VIALRTLRLTMTSAQATSTSETSEAKAPRRLDVLDAVRELFEDDDLDAILALLAKLLAAHREQLRELLQRTKRRSSGKSEGVTKKQLDWLLKQLQQTAEQQPDDAPAVKDQKDADASLKSAAKPEPPAGQKVDHPRPPPPRRRPIPAGLPIVDNFIAVPEAQRPCPICGKERDCFDHETTRVIDIEPARVIVRADHREKRRCAEHGEIVTAPLGDKVVEGGAYGSRLVSELLVAKYDEGMPLERQHERFLRLGLDMPTASMGDQVTWATELLAPIARGLIEEVLASDVMHLDGTSVPVLDKKAPNGIKLGALWGYAGVDIRVVDGQAFEERRAAYIYMRRNTKNGDKAHGELGAEEMLERRRKKKKPNVCCDADGRFDASFRRPGLVELGCNMHGRRYFKKALDAGDVRASLPIAAFKRIYDVEERAKGKTPDERLAMRQAESLPVYRELVSWCETYLRTELPSSLLFAAVRYLTNHKDALMRFLDDGALPIDNGLVERLHRTPIMGVKNWLFCGSDAGGERAAIAFTVLATCKLVGVNPVAYLADVLPRLARGIVPARDLPALMPAVWARAQPP
jgi:transposase